MGQRVHNINIFMVYIMTHQKGYVILWYLKYVIQISIINYSHSLSPLEQFKQINDLDLHRVYIFRCDTHPLNQYAWNETLLCVIYRYLWVGCPWTNVGWSRPIDPLTQHTSQRINTMSTLGRPQPHHSEITIYNRTSNALPAREKTHAHPHTQSITHTRSWWRCSLLLWWADAHQPRLALSCLLCSWVNHYYKKCNVKW